MKKYFLALTLIIFVQQSIVAKDFWQEYGDASGVFQMGECFNGDPAYVGPYQDYLTGLFNYPMYYTIKDVWGSGKSMYNIKNRLSEEA